MGNDSQVETNGRGLLASKVEKKRELNVLTGLLVSLSVVFRYSGRTFKGNRILEQLPSGGTPTPPVFLAPGSGVCDRGGGTWPHEGRSQGLVGRAGLAV